MATPSLLFPRMNASLDFTDLKAMKDSLTLPSDKRLVSVPSIVFITGLSPELQSVLFFMLSE